MSSDGLVHEPGAVLRDLVVMLADGGDDFSAIETLRGQVDLGGAVAWDSTAWRRVADLAGDELSVVRLDAARRPVRATVWRHDTQPRRIRGTGQQPPPQRAARVVLDAEDRAIHEAGHRPGCWCLEFDAERFYREQFDRCLGPRGFTCLPSENYGQVISNGPGIRAGRVAALKDAIRAGAVD